MFDFLKRLPKTIVIGEQVKSEGVNFDGAYTGQTLVNILYGPKVPTKTYTIGINGRGSLVMEEQEYRDLLSSMIGLFETRCPGYIAPKPAA